LSNLGGDDFDRVLARLAIGDRLNSLEPAALYRLEDECRRQKEALHPNSRRVVVDLDTIEEGLGTVTVPVADYYEACRPLLEQTVDATTQLADKHALDVLYVTGGGSELPIVARMLREVFGRKVKRSEYTRSATAIGLAIQAGATSDYTLHEVFTRNFGVWREANAGHAVRFDTIFPVGTRLPSPGNPPLTVTRDYAPAHNIGHFRYLESSTLTDLGEPSGDIAVWDEILFPLDPNLSDEKTLAEVAVTREVDTEQRIEERYACDATGTATVTIRNLTAGYEREFRLGRWNEKARVVKPSAATRGRSRQASSN
jgi:molecular chaperone DnaK (HSP70)